MKKLFLALCAALTGITSCAQSDTRYTTQDNTQFARTIADPAVQLVDVRTAQEYAEGYIPGAINLDIQRADFDTQAATLDKSHPVAVYCRSGVRSRRAAERLAEQGFVVYNLDGGITRWNGKTTK